MPKAISTSKTYENLLNTIAKKKLRIKTAKAGVNILNNNNLKINIIAPNNDSYSNLNNFSAVIKITYGNKFFLFMGDAETKSENEIISNVSADVIKIGHHGSDSSSGQSFINKVNAKYAIISVGSNNKYEHPYQTVIDRWTNSGTIIYRTDINGNIIVTSDGNSIDIISSK
jgi:beta-lactamase superfamily II metal-dependent hydrolase